MSPEIEAATVNETRYLLVHCPTVRQVQQLNRESTMLFPLSMLNAMVDAGLDLTKRADARVVSRLIETSELVDLQYDVMEGGTLIARLATVDEPDGAVFFVAVLKRRVADWLL